MSALLEDVSVETGRDRPPPPEPAPLDILATATALQRAVTFFQAAPLNHLLFYLATISYRKVFNRTDDPQCLLLIIEIFY